MHKRSVVLVLLFCLVQTMGFAEIADSGANGFTIKITTSIHATPADVYKKLVRNVGDWWDPRHTFSGDSHNLSIEEKSMGCFCEKLPNGGGVRHMEVLYFQPGQTLRLSGALGPLQELGAVGTLTFALKADGGETKLEATYALVGYQSQGMSHWAAPVDGVLIQQVTRLKNFVETGNPAGPAPQKLPA